MGSKKVTVVIPVYNAAQHLARCLTSLVKQSINSGVEAPYLVHVIDDGSSDNSLEIALNFQARYPYLFTVESQSNMGVAATRNKGIGECTTPYIMFIDNDDYVDEDYIERHLKAIEATRAEVVISGYRREDCSGKTIEKVQLTNDRWSRYRCIVPWARLFDTAFLQDSRILFFENNIGEDVLFSLRVYSAARCVEIIPYSGYVWFYNESSTSNTLHKGLKQECRFDFLLAEAAKQFDRTDLLGRYYLNRLIVWYLLYSGKEATRERFTECARELFGWLVDNGYGCSPFMLSEELRSEPRLNRLAVALMGRAYQTPLLSIFALLYCRG